MIHLKDTFKDQNISFSVQCDISDGEKVSSDLLKEYNEEINDEYDVNLKIKEMYEVDVKLKLKATNDGEEKNNDLNQTIYVGKINGKWYILSD